MRDDRGREDGSGSRVHPRPGPSSVCLLPLGSTEQHGAHLPVDTDTRIAVAVAAALASERDGAVVLPPLGFGSSGEHQGFAGTVSIGTGALAHVLVELGRSASEWATRLLVVNAHGGNLDALRQALPVLRGEGRDAAWLACRTAEHPTDTHAGHAETSLMLHLHPESVRPDLAEPGCTRPLDEILPALRGGGVAAVSPTGVLGDPTTATADEGARLWSAVVDDAAGRLDRWSPGDHGMLG